MNAVIKLIPITIIYVSVVVFTTNYILLKYLKFTDSIPDLAFYVIYSFILYSFYGYYVSSSASRDKCNQINRPQASLDGLKTAIVSVVVYLIIYIISYFRSPFNELFGSFDTYLGDDFSNSLAETFYISLNLIILSISTYHNSAKKNCKIKAKDIENSLVKLDKYLNSKKKNKKFAKNIEIKG